MDKEEKGRWSMARNFRRRGWRREHELHTAVSARSALSLLLGLLGRANDLLTHRTVHIAAPMLFRQGRSDSFDTFNYPFYERKEKKKRKRPRPLFLNFANKLSSLHLSSSTNCEMNPSIFFARFLPSLPLPFPRRFINDNGRDFGRGFLNRPLRNGVTSTVTWLNCPERGDQLCNERRYKIPAPAFSLLLLITDQPRRMLFVERICLNH